MVKPQKEVRFGINQINQPTPLWVKRAARIFFYATGSITIILDVFTEIPVEVKLIISNAVIKANLLVTALSKLFGVNLTAPTNTLN